MGKKTSTSTTKDDTTTQSTTVKTPKAASGTAGEKKVAKTAGKKSSTRKTATAPARELKYEYSRLPRQPLLRLIKEMAHKVDAEARVQGHILDRLEQIVQDYMSNLVSNTVLAARKEKRKTIMEKDLDFILEIQGAKPASNSNSSNVASTTVAPPATATASSN
jgi:histone H3/H4